LSTDVEGPVSRNVKNNSITHSNFRASIASPRFNRYLFSEYQAVLLVVFISLMPHSHPNLDSKRNAVAKLEGFGDSLVTPCTKTQQSKAKVSPIAPLKAVASYT
jgi:hypothetical protein